MPANERTVTRADSGVLATNKLIRNTYILLSLTLMFSAATAGLSMVLGWSQPGLLLTFAGYFGFLFLTQRFRNSVWGLVFVFALTGFMGLTLGPIIETYLKVFANGGELVMTALGGTAVIFVGLSAYALLTRKNFSFIGGFVMVGILVAFLAGIAAMLFSIPGLSLAVRAGRMGNTYPAVFCAADEIAVEAFLNRRIKFTFIPALIEAVMEAHRPEGAYGLEAIQAADARAREDALRIIKGRV